jgi:hypothetical protein
VNEHDEHLVARLEERVNYLQEQLNIARNALHEYVRLERYLRVEIAVFGIIGVVMSALLLMAFNKLIGQ